MAVVRDRWTLTAVFDSMIEVTDAGSDILADFPMGESAGFYGYIRRYWECGDDEWLDESTNLTGDTVTATTNSLDSLMEPMHWIMFNTSPKSVTLERDGTR